MHFAFTEEQILFRQTVHDILSARCTPADVRAAWENDTGQVDGLWEQLAETGVVGLTAPSDFGGLGMADVDLVGIMEEVGRAAAPGPLLEHTAVVIPALAEAGRTDELAALADGSEVATVVNPRVPYGLCADSATWLLAEVDGQLRFGSTEGLQMHAQAALDHSRRLFRIDVPHGWGDALNADPDRAFDRGVVAAAAQCVGVARHLIETTVEYVSARQQFGKAVGTYQAVKHHLANAAMAVEFAAPAVTWAAWATAENIDTRSREVSMAKVLASDAVDLAAKHALQCHGAIGYTFEYDLQLWLKRAWALSAAWGDAGWHRDRVGRALGV